MSEKKLYRNPELRFVIEDDYRTFSRKLLAVIRGQEIVADDFLNMPELIFQIGYNIDDYHYDQMVLGPSNPGNFYLKLPDNVVIGVPDEPT